MEYELRYIRSLDLVILSDASIILAAQVMAETWPRTAMPYDQVTAYTALCKLMGDIPAINGWETAAQALLTAGMQGQLCTWKSYASDLFRADYSPLIAFDPIAPEIELLRLACRLGDQESIDALLQKNVPKAPHRSDGVTANKVAHNVTEVHRSRSSYQLGGLAGTSAAYALLIQHGHHELAVELLQQHSLSIHHRPGVRTWNANLGNQLSRFMTMIDQAGHKDLAIFVAMMIDALPSVEQALASDGPRFDYDSLRREDPQRDQRLAERAKVVSKHQFDNPAIKRGCLLFTLDCPPAATVLADEWIKTLTAQLGHSYIEGIDARYNARMREVGYRTIVSANRFDVLKSIAEQMIQPQPNRQRHVAALKAVCA